MGHAGGVTASAEPRGYLAYYGLRRPPFERPADPRSLWLGNKQREALATLSSAIRRGDGIIVVIGDAGTGKTALLQWLIEMLGGDSLIVGRLPRSVFEVSELSQAVADAFGLDGHFPTAAAFAPRFREFLVSAQARGRSALLVIDDAQGLGDDLLRKVFDLSNIGAFEEQPFAILLAGQRELGVALSNEQHAGWRQRITARCTLDPLTPDEVAEYVQFRLQAAGSEEAIFAAESLRQIASISQGAPGVIDMVCERALASGWRRQSRIIGVEIIDDALGAVGPQKSEPTLPPVDLPRGRRQPSVRMRARRRARRTAMTVGIILLGAVMLGAGTYAIYRGRVSHVQRDPVPPTASAPPAEGMPDRAAVASPPPVAVSNAQEAGSDKTAPPAPRLADDSPTLAPPGPRPTRMRSAPGDAGTGTASKNATPNEPLPRRRADVRAPERETGATDPGAIIDWLMRDSARR
jgi:type II secretory pathway predicted ATPase ExeA